MKIKIINRYRREEINWWIFWKIHITLNYLLAVHRCDHACFLPKWETIYLQRRIEVVKMAIQIYRGGERESENVREATCLCCNKKCTNSIYREGGTKTFMGCVIEFGQDKRCSETQVSLYLFTCFRNMYTKNVCLNRSLLSLEMGFCFCHRSMGMFVHIYIYLCKIGGGIGQRIPWERILSRVFM